jgi:phosphoglycerate dehydrogenase-like enzyme
MPSESRYRETNILFLREVNDRLREYLISGLNDLPVNLIFPEDTSEEKLLKLAPEANIMVGWRPTKALLDAAENLSLFINPGAGVQHLISLFREVNETRQITLVNGHGNSYFTAQHAVAILLALTNKVIPHHNWMTDGKWRMGDAEAASIPLRERKIGLLGYGAVNQKVHQFLSGFDVEFFILRRDWSKQQEQLPTPAKRYEFHELHIFLKAIDVLIIAVPMTNLTKDLIGMPELKLLGESGLLVNVARGSVVNEENLYNALKNDLIAGAAIDVWYNYRPEEDETGRKFPSKYPFYELENVVLSPHRAASPFSDLHRWNEVIENIKRFATGERSFLNVISLEDEY